MENEKPYVWSLITVIISSTRSQTGLSLTSRFKCPASPKCHIRLNNEIRFRFTLKRSNHRAYYLPQSRGTSQLLISSNTYDSRTNNQSSYPLVLIKRTNLRNTSLLLGTKCMTQPRIDPQLHRPSRSATF